MYLWTNIVGIFPIGTKKAMKKYLGQNLTLKKVLVKWYCSLFSLGQNQKPMVGQMRKLNSFRTKKKGKIKIP